MKNYIIPALIIITSALSACNQMIGGPSDDEIKRIAKEEMLKNTAHPELAQVADQAQITPKGMCNHVKEKYACGIEVKLPNQDKPNILVVQLKKDSAGKWMSAQ